MLSFTAYYMYDVPTSDATAIECDDGVLGLHPGAVLRGVRVVGPDRLDTGVQFNTNFEFWVQNWVQNWDKFWDNFTSSELFV